VLVVGIGLLVLATSLYMVIVLEILKFGRLRAWAGRRQAAEPDSTERVA
jgi:hypothetical protein